MPCEFSRGKLLVAYAGTITFLLLVILFYRGQIDFGKVNVITLNSDVLDQNATLQTTTVSHSIFRMNTLRTTPAIISRNGQECGDYVIFSNGFRDGRGLGNQMFNLAAGVLIAKLTGRRIAVNHSVISHLYLEELFDFTYQRFNKTCEIYSTGDKFNLAYNPELELLEASKTTNFASKTISISGFFQSWKYTINEDLLRSKYLRIKTEFKNLTEAFFAKMQPVGWRPDTFTRVGIHVRRGDVLTDHNKHFGYTTPSASYFKNAMMYMMMLYKRVQFVVVSNDKPWIFSNLNAPLFKDVNTTSFLFDIIHSTSNSRELEFTLLASCHHTIMSTGTFGWWAAWLSRGTTIYYKEWPRKGSPLETKFKKEDFFPPDWIGLSD